MSQYRYGRISRHFNQTTVKIATKNGMYPYIPFLIVKQISDPYSGFGASTGQTPEQAPQSIQALASIMY